MLAQLARHHGVRVIGAAAPRHHDALRALGVEPVDHADPARLVARVRELAPGGVDAVFDNLGGDSLTRSWQLLTPTGTLVSYAIAALPEGVSLPLAFARTLARLAWWNALPNGRCASFYSVWAGRLRSPKAFRARRDADLSAVLDLLASGVLTAHIAARVPLSEAVRAMELAESRRTVGKVVLVPGNARG